jgi:hypothetical protein
VAFLALVLALLTAILSAMAPKASAIDPAPGLAAFVLALVLALMVVAPNYPGATAYLILCGFSRTRVWRHSALAAIGAGVLCGLGAATGASPSVRRIVADAPKLPQFQWETADTAMFLMILGVAVAGAALGLWIGARLLNAAAPRRLRAQAEAVVAAVCVTSAMGTALVVFETATAQGGVAFAAFSTAVVFLWLSRVIFVRIEPLQE